jgi:hypothetical protein
MIFLAPVAMVLLQLRLRQFEALLHAVGRIACEQTRTCVATSSNSQTLKCENFSQRSTLGSVFLPGTDLFVARFAARPM